MKALDDSANTDRCTLYEDSANVLKDECFAKAEYQTSAKLQDERRGARTQESPREFARQSEAKLK